MFVRASPRWVDDEAALTVMRAVRGRADLVGVFVAPSRPSATRPRRATGSPPCRCTDASTPTSPPAALFLSFLSSTCDSRAAAYTHRLVARTCLVMLDGMPAQGGLPGGTGHRVPLRVGRRRGPSPPGDPRRRARHLTTSRRDRDGAARRGRRVEPPRTAPRREGSGSWCATSCARARGRGAARGAARR